VAKAVDVAVERATLFSRSIHRPHRVREEEVGPEEGVEGVLLDEMEEGGH